MFRGIFDFYHTFVCATNEQGQYCGSVVEQVTDQLGYSIGTGIASRVSNSGCNQYVANLNVAGCCARNFVTTSVVNSFIVQNTAQLSAGMANWGACARLYSGFGRSLPQQKCANTSDPAFGSSDSASSSSDSTALIAAIASCAALLLVAVIVLVLKLRKATARNVVSGGRTDGDIQNLVFNRDINEVDA